MSHSGSRIIPKDGASTGELNSIVEDTDHVQFVRPVSDHELDIVRGLDQGKFSFHRFGSNGLLPNGSFADIWSYGPTDPTYNWPTAAEGFRVRAGGNVNDAAGGTGARSVVLDFLDATGNRVTETVVTAGASASASTVVPGRRLIRAAVGNDVGTILGNNIGDILIENDTTNEVVAYIQAGIGQTQMSMYTIPLGFTGYLIRVEVNSATSKSTDIFLWQRQLAFATAAPFGAKRLVRSWLEFAGDTAIADYKSPPVFPELTDIWFSARGNANISSCGVDVDLICVVNP
jgi:hypothetical protein